MADENLAEKENLIRKWTGHRDNRDTKGNMDLEKDPSTSAKFELKGEEAREVTHLEGENRPISGPTKSTRVEPNQYLHTTSRPNANGPACHWKVYSRNSWYRKQNRNAKSPGPNPGQENRTNTKEITQFNTDTGKEMCSPTMTKISGMQKMIEWDDHGTKRLGVEEPTTNTRPTSAKLTEGQNGLKVDRYGRKG